MEKTIDKLLDLIYKKIDKGLPQIESKGLIDGKAGIALFLYAYAEKKQSKRMHKKADKLIDDIWDVILLTQTSSNFASGQAGVGWFSEWLREKELLDIDTEVENLLMSFDTRQFQLNSQTPAQVELQSSLFSSGLYFFKRYAHYQKQKNNDKKSLHYKHALNEQIIYLTDECERILHENTAFNNAFNPKLTLRLLNSIFYFLVCAHEYKIFPYKTISLIAHCIKLSKKLIASSNISDIITLNKLLDRTEYGGKNIAGYSNIKSEDPFIILSQSGLYSLLYQNHAIFNEALHCLLKQNPDFMKQFVQKLKEDNVSLSFDGLAAIGYGMLFYYEIN